MSTANGKKFLCFGVSEVFVLSDSFVTWQRSNIMYTALEKSKSFMILINILVKQAAYMS